PGPEALPIVSARIAVTLRTHPCRDDRLDAAANVEVTDHLHPPRFRDARDVVENAVHGALVEDAVVAKAPEIELEALELDAAVSGHVRDVDDSEVRSAAAQLCELTCVSLDSTQRAERRELRAFHSDLVV